jgi:DNA-binding winged helix-turn-helix (wHTH) protein
MSAEFASLEATSEPDKKQDKEAETVTVYAGRYARFSGFCLDLLKHELCKDGVRIKMQGKVCDVLTILLETPGEVVTREALRARLWPPDTRVNYDANVNTTVNKLRQVLGDSSDQSTFVETVPRKGYSFIALVEFSDEAPPWARAKGSARAAFAGTSEGRAALVESAMSSMWFKAGVIALLVAGLLLWAAIFLYTHHGV